MDARQLGNRRDAEQIPELGAQHVHQRGVVACEQVGLERAPHERIDTIKAQVYGIPLIRPCEPPDETCCTSVGTVRSTALRAAGGTHRPAGEHRAGGRGRTGYTPAEAGPPRGLVGGLASSGTDGGGGARCRVENGADRHSPQLGGARAGTDSSTGKPRWVRIRRITAGSSMVAMTRIRPPHRGQAKTSSANTWRSSSAQLRRLACPSGDAVRVLPPAAGAAVGLGDCSVTSCVGACIRFPNSAADAAHASPSPSASIVSSGRR